MKGRLTRRMVFASGALAVIVTAAFAILLAAVSELRDSGRLAQHSFEELAGANELEKLVIDVETGVRGFLLTREERLLEPANAARPVFPQRARELVALADDPGQQQLAQRLAVAATAYVRGYSTRLIQAARRDAPGVRSLATTEDGKRRVDALRALFGRYERRERDLARREQDRAEDAAHRATAAAAAGLAGSVGFIVLFGGYLLRAITLPVRHAADMAKRLAGGDLSVRMPETGPGEIGDLERAFNTMGRSLEASRDELRQLAEEQAALRRVATLVARRTPPYELFAAVAQEVRALLGAASTRLWRREADGTYVAVANDSEPSAALPLGTRMRLDDDEDVMRAMRTTDGSTRIDDLTVLPGHGGEAQSLGLRSALSRAILVEGREWGMMSVGWPAVQVPAGAEARLREFSELVGTAVANAQSRAELAASRARVVAASDATRRQIERDLHDGAQQRLVSLGLELRAIEARVPTELAAVKEQVAGAAAGVGAVTDELREISRGIHPAILSRGGLAPALKALARRSAVPTGLDLALDGPLPERVEVAAYYIVSEALTNAAKHAGAESVSVAVATADGVLRLAVRDDGSGGADPAGGTGLVGLKDRVAALGGTIDITSPPGEGTTLRAEIPIADGASTGVPPAS